MSAPKLDLTVEPFDGGSVVYAPTAAPASTKGEQGRIMLQLSLTSHESSDLSLENLTVTLTGPGSYPQASVPLRWYWTPSGGSEQSAPVTVPAGGATLWWFQHPADNVLFDDTRPPTGIELAVTADGHTDPATFSFPLAPHAAPPANGAYLFPAVTADLAGEYWETNGATHDVGAEGSQSFAYDLGVWGEDGTGGWSWLKVGANGTKNKDFRIWDKPIHAMADGTVNQVLFDVPTNPKPLTGPDWDAQFAAQKAATWGKWLTDHGYDYDADEPHAGAGNHLYLQHGDEIVLYAHMRPNTIPKALRTPGAPVTAGDFLGHAGNSGNSSAPHLHVHAIKGTVAEEGPLRPLVFAPFRTLETDLPAESSPPWSSVSHGRSPAPLDAVIWPAATPLRKLIGEEAIDPLALLLRNDIYVLLTLPDPPPLEQLVQQFERQLRTAGPEVRQALAQRLGRVRELAAQAQEAARKG